MNHNIISLLYDFDFTLSPHYMQEPLFRKYGVEGKRFWGEKEALTTDMNQKGINLDDECAYMNLILRYVRKGTFSDLSNRKLRELGQEITFFPGLPEFFPRINEMVQQHRQYQAHNLTVEHYVISTGLKEMIAGSAIGSSITDVFASEYSEEDGVISEIARTVGYLKKTQFIYTINKGANKDRSIDINGVLPRELRRVPFENMIYIGDGPTDVPCFAMLNKHQGHCFAVYNPDSESAFEKAYVLRQQGRVFDFAPADYRHGSHLSRTVEFTVKKIAEQIIQSRDELVQKNSSAAPRHG